MVQTALDTMEGKVKEKEKKKREEEKKKKNERTKYVALSIDGHRGFCKGLLGNDKESTTSS